MLSSFKHKLCGEPVEVEFSGLGKMNLFTGASGTGKTRLLYDVYKQCGSKRLGSMPMPLRELPEKDWDIRTHHGELVENDFNRDALKALRGVMGGELVWEDRAWHFRCVGRKGVKVSIPLGRACSSVRNIATVYFLLWDGTISEGSRVCLDDFGDTLHPAAIVGYLDALKGLTDKGVQFFFTSNSYFVVKKLYLLAQTHKMSIPFFQLDGGYLAQPFGCEAIDVEFGYPFRDDFLEGMPKNSILDMSVSLYQEEMNL